MDRARGLFKNLLDFFFPCRCLICKEEINSTENSFICDSCLKTFTELGKPLCYRCGRQFKSGRGGNHLCSECIKKNPPFDRARSVWLYEGVLRESIQNFKYYNLRFFAKPFGRLLSDAGQNLLGGKNYNFIMPVPLQVKRLRDRGYNQSLLVSKEIGRLWGVEVCFEALTRHKETAPQTKLPLKNRHKNVKGAFSYEGISLKGKNVLIVDDVFTTGATVRECAKVLKKNRARVVDVLTIARTP